jgi:Amidohydrolase family
MADQLGTLQTGKFADLTILEKDPYTVDPDALMSIAVSETWVGGVPCIAKVRKLDVHANPPANISQKLRSPPHSMCGSLWNGRPLRRLWGRGQSTPGERSNVRMRFNKIIPAPGLPASLPIMISTCSRVIWFT